MSNQTNEIAEHPKSWDDIRLPSFNPNILEEKTETHSMCRRRKKQESDCNYQRCI